MICFILVALFVLFFVWGGAFIEGRHSFENTYFKGALIRGGRSLQNIYFKGGAHSRGALIRRGALFRGNTVTFWSLSNVLYSDECWTKEAFSMSKQCCRFFVLL